jgi:hypothetical protein
MLLPLPPKLHRPSRSFRKASRAPAQLVLTGCTFNVSGTRWVRLVFDRAVNIAGPLLLTGITVDDNVSTDTFYTGSGAATLFDPVTVQVPLIVAGSAHGGSLTLLGAPDDTGIVAADDGGTWEGGSAVSIPF